jgi:hypothetical protein
MPEATSPVNVPVNVPVNLIDISDIKRDVELLSERLGKTQDYL